MNSLTDQCYQDDSDLPRPSDAGFKPKFTVMMRTVDEQIRIVKCETKVINGRVHLVLPKTVRLEE